MGDLAVSVTSELVAPSQEENGLYPLSQEALRAP